MLTRRVFSASLLAGLAAPATLTAQPQSLEAVRTESAAMAQLHAILIQRGDEVLLAQAHRGPGLGRLANIKSCSKSVLALLLGAAIEDGAIDGLSARLGDVAPGLIPADATDGVQGLTMQDLVTMQTGLQGTSGARYGAWVSSRNWVATVLRQPRLSPSGEVMTYSTGTTHVLGAALATATGQSLLAQARERLGRPLGIEIPPWTRDPQGFFFGGNEMALTPEAMLRIAVLMRDGGRFEGEQVLPAQWIRASHVARTRSPYSGLTYGYGWFHSPAGWTLARGYGGQIIAAHPERALAVAITSDPLQPARSQGHFGALLALLDGPVLALA